MIVLFPRSNHLQLRSPKSIAQHSKAASENRDDAFLHHQHCSFILKFDMCRVIANQQAAAPLTMGLISPNSGYPSGTTPDAYIDRDMAIPSPVASSTSAASIAMASHPDRSLKCLDYLIARTKMDLQLAMKMRENLLAKWELQSSGAVANQHAEAVVSSDVSSSSSLALISQIDRSNECIEILLAETQMKLQIARNEYYHLHQTLIDELEMRAILSDSLIYELEMRAILFDYNLLALNTRRSADME